MGKLFIVGLGPGNNLDMSERAKKALQTAEVIVGYKTYIKLIPEFLHHKTVLQNGMFKEVERCKQALQAAQDKTVAIVSSGDAGIYGMAGLILELNFQLPKDKRPTIEVIPGISAVNAAASLLGAPLTNDFAVISLSDLLTPWPLIEKRVQLAAEGDFVIALYNPKSKKRVQQIEIVRSILLKHRSPETPVGIVRSASRTGESITISTLDKFTKEDIDMLSTVIIGNSQSYRRDNFIITPRGYKL